MCSDFLPEDCSDGKVKARWNGIAVDVARPMGEVDR